MLAEASMRLAEAFQRLAEASQKLAEAFQKLAEAFQRLAEALKRLAEAFKRLTKAFQRLTEASRRTDGHMYIKTMRPFGAAAEKVSILLFSDASLPLYKMVCSSKMCLFKSRNERVNH